MSHTRKLFENVISLYVLQGANYLLPLIVLPYLVRVLGVEKFGLIAFSQALMQFLALFTDYGFNWSATRKIASNRGDPGKLSQICSNVLTIKLSLVLVSFLLLLLLVLFIPKFAQDRGVYLASFLLVLGSALFPLWYFQGIEQMKTITLINVIGRTIGTLGIFLFVKHKSDYVLAALMQALGFGVIGIIGISVMFYFRKLSLAWVSIKSLKEELVDGWHVFLSTAAISFYTSGTAFFLGILSNNLAVGYFSAGDKVIKALIQLTSPISQSIYPHINSIFKQSQDAAKVFISKTTRYLGGVTLFISVSAFIFTPYIIHILFGKGFEPAITVTRWMAILPFVVSINTIFGVQTMLTFGFNKAFSKILLFSAILNLILMVPLIHFFQSEGAAMAVTFTECAVTFLMGWALKRKKLLFHFHKYAGDEC